MYYAVTLGSTYDIQKNKGIFWAPSKDKNGTGDVSWYNHIKNFKINDVLFAFVDSHLTTIIKVESEPEKSKIPEEMIDSKGEYLYYPDGFMVKATYTYFQNEIPKAEIQKLFENIDDSIFAKNDRIKQQYIQKLSNEIGNKIFDKIINYPQKIITAELEDIKKNLDEFNNLSGKDIDVLSKARVNQGKIRSNLLKQHKCCQLCGVENENLLIASHIKPWSKSTEKERVDCYNLLLLCANHDKLFDRFLITFDDDGKIKMSSSLSENDKMFTNIKETAHLKFPNNKKLPDKMREYLEWHRQQFENKESKRK